MLQEHSVLQTMQILPICYLFYFVFNRTLNVKKKKKKSFISEIE